MSKRIHDAAARYVVGVDVGTGSARAGLFDLQGRQLHLAKQAIITYQDSDARYEQSSDNIWQAVCACVKSVVAASNLPVDAIVGLSFDATCSLVVLGDNQRPLPVGEHGIADRNVIVWMDQRATEQARLINDLEHPVLHYVGNRISPEMETPKLLWLKTHLPDTYHSARHFFDLTDYLTFRASNSDARSICTLVCKWTYLAHEKRWDASYFESIGLADLVDDHCAKIGTHVVAPGTALGQGLTVTAAEELGLHPGTAVAAGLIDAHAGGVGSVGALTQAGTSAPEDGLAYVFGTSACTLTTSTNPVTVPGIWGPYFAAMIPGMWLNEAGQSAAGAAIDHLVLMHPASAQATLLAHDAGIPLTVWLSQHTKKQLSNLSDAVHLAQNVHLVPEFLGNRAPFADPNARAIMAGLTMDKSLDSLVSLYVAGLCGIAYGLRQIIEAQAEKGLFIQRVVISGGAGQDPLIRQLIADATGKEVVAPTAEEPVLLGTAMLAAVASGDYEGLEHAMQAMSSFGGRYLPSPSAIITQRHEARFLAFTKLQTLAREL
ncbi:FGGY-family carbohydrate kinase [Marinomonas sp. IMCC 4694]|uniref:FGGY-family carbohydrate kinase n=1 Tax=Marinomonas sp. IMCC 4694 TaxID=2605432 RepID=UPI0011E7C73B|nr:FGGY-family carbohydrate kinase [Marinomonas sp. IMCC 4694]TYL46972.1 FGGY-family carbohydrate kinase [Marinomonas sp. IMCC 4694]